VDDQWIFIPGLDWAGVKKKMKTHPHTCLIERE
jgi:hypothetical protein